MTKLTIHLSKNLGDILFQIFTLLSQARKQRCDYIIENNSLYFNKLLSNIKLTEEIKTTLFTDYYEKCDKLYEELPRFHNNTRLNGYFQSDKYLTEIRRDLFDYIKLNDTDNSKVLEIYQNLRKKSQDKSLIFINIRKGDYNLPSSYYEKALRYFNPVLHHFVIFSDDLDYTSNKLDHLPNKDYIELEDYLSLYLMSLLDGGIMANSSLSWWGAYLLELRKELNHENTPQIVQPARWFSYGSILPNDRIVRKKNWSLVE